jgi:ferredoxin--NADP+ reductase
MEGADVAVLPSEVELDALSEAALNADPDRAVTKKLEILREFAQREPSGKPKLLTIRFLVSPVELIGDDAGQVVGMRLVRNVLYETEKGRLRPRPTDQFEDLPVQLVFRSVGYRGVPLAGLPFNNDWGVVPNAGGRVVEPETGEPVRGVYVSGWIKRGPSGVIGTNKPDAAETVKAMVADVGTQQFLQPTATDHGAVERLVAERQPDYVSYEDWRRLDELEVARGKPLGRPRVKFTSVEEMLTALGRGAEVTSKE